MKMTAIEKNRIADEAQDKPLEEAVAAWLARQQEFRRVRMPHCAEALGYSEYGLRNRLAYRKQTYQELLDQERRRRFAAIQEKHDDGLVSLNGDKLAPILGLSNGDVFRKWYRRQYGVNWKNRSKRTEEKQ